MSVPPLNDYGKLKSVRPARVCAPASAEEVATLVSDARRGGERLVVRGAGHSQGGQTLKQDATVVLTRKFDGVEIGDGVARIGAGATVAQVEAALEGTGQTLAVYPAYWGITLGGLIATGGIGTMSFREGIVADRAMRLEAVLGTGEIVECGPDKRPEVFDALRGTQGALGIVTSVTMALRPNPLVRHWRFEYRDARLAAEDLLALADDPACVYLRLNRMPMDGQIWYLSASGAGAGGEALPKRARADRKFDLGEETGCILTLTDWAAIMANYRPWRDWWLPEEMLEEALRAKWLEWTKLTPQTWTGVWLVRRGWNRAPFVITPREERMVGYSVLPYCWSADKARQAQAHLADVDRLLVGRGGKTYLSGRTDYGEAEWRAHYGERWDALVAAKDALDPDGVLAGGER